MFAGVIQGPTEYWQKMIQDYRTRFDVLIFSTWNDELQENLRLIKESGVELITSTKPSSGIHNLNLQCHSTLTGIKKAIELGCTHVAKIRSDMSLCDSGDIFIKKELLTHIFWHEHEGGYLTDFINFGPSEEMFQFWNTSCRGHGCPEIQLTENYFQKIGIEKTFEASKKKVEYCYQQILDKDIVLFWHKRGYDLKICRNDGKFRW